ncbi:MAG: hypothetical protein PHC61_16260 [Chitinivibrionales bacterium]|nr:hypothetical protein [Chitinivibrionales bacterium]
MDICRSSTHSAGGVFWFAGWLFTIGFAKLAGWKIVFSLFIWPYYIGKLVALHGVG